MKVLVMDTGRGINAEKVGMWRAHLGLDEADQLILVSWFLPQGKVPLPVTAHLLCGPVLNLGQEAVLLPVQAARAEDPEDEAAPLPSGGTAAWTGADEAVTDTSGGLSPSELDEQLTEQEADPAQAAAADQDPADQTEAEAPDQDGAPDVLADGAPAAQDPASGVAAPGTRPTDLSHLPVHDLRRVRQAVRWRRKWAQRRASRFASRQVRRARSFADGSQHLPSTLVSSALRARKDAISWEYTLATTRSRTVNAAFATADVVVPVDQRSQKAAWLLARRHAGPDVIVTLPAAARAVAARRPAGPSGPAAAPAVD
ncbi:hypothetical protein [Ornithinimicrobium pekingense]|uniref:Uncharacterized protein n=1 Tax=Ornithinimicrobium pekingense TaxID=384677 RepID=A0ABQ2FA76_9MICO|nr:hypothetical protein [Ornithinimicrobium pekingense]GGK67686.1 hypothetical protein GCM10011509_15080 [Ornithinimicrobium pekingense]